MTVAGLDGFPEDFVGRVLTEPEDMAPFLVDWRGMWRGAARAVLQPDTTEGVAQALRWCRERHIPVVPQGGNTGLSGGSVPDASGDAIVLSLARMRAIRAVDTVNDTITVEAGVVLQSVQDAAAAAGRLFPLSLAAEGSCTIGGNLATNAGGTGVLRYGNARELCLGLEVVTAAGEVWNGLRGLRKDNTGYDLRDLFIGSEGTLGIITAAVLKLFPRPAARGVAFVACPDVAAALALLALARGALGPGLTGFELVPRIGLDMVLRHVPDTQDPLAAQSPWYVLIETSDFDGEESAAARLEAVLGQAFEAELITDGAVAQSIGQAQALWALRENLSEAQGAEGPCVKHDVSVPISALGPVIAEIAAGVEQRHPGTRLVVFGHLGDGNLHVNVSPGKGADGAELLARQPDINAFVHDLVVAHGGSISAEHGLGVLRRDEAARYKSAVEMELMRGIKAALDPQGILNPGKLLVRQG